jgi:hypothetical protein
MGRVMITCPDTGEGVSTGIEMDETSFSYIPRTEAFYSCPSCGGKHRLSEAWLDQGAAANLVGGSLRLGFAARRAALR